ncbi:glycosyltransferase family 9 protein [Desulfovibrio ferrophilus]|uniref:Glycosyl transferase family 9 n=1 Tax=Desulfovibrio ferrophilus TaxID=241368 RepID=A0A2Z6B066_9BACT|nr:glycosyltransferase family 9 protein [Desulfovibrio ferrophilus]BBD08902.1 glycosyl transferase family 9 [Desulfovibrio ferrophilus]
MSSQRPILILQMQRMGDLILSYPLVLWLSRRYPGRPIWMMAEELFYKQLMQVNPGGVTFFPWAERSLAHLRSHKYELVINLSHDPRAAALAGQVESEEVFGPVSGEDGLRYIRGDWALYRASLVRSNRHNRFHWADLNALDVVSLDDIATTNWSVPRTITKVASRKVGLFLGASQEAKRPSVGFWQKLGSELLKRDLRPVLLGGPAEVELAQQVARGIPARVINFAGQQTLAELAYIGQTLGMMVTPDTGPMHLAAWTGLRTLNLSMGNVNCWETGPYQAGHFVLRARMSCSGCWHCHRARTYCHDHFLPRQVAFIIDRINQKEQECFAKRRLPDLELMETGQSRQGLYSLKSIAPAADPSARELLGLFWQQYWGARFGLWPMDEASSAFSDIYQQYPRMRDAMRGGLVRLSRDLRRGLTPGGGRTISDDFWHASSPALQPARSYCQLYLENGDMAPSAWAGCLGLVEELLDLM